MSHELKTPLANIREGTELLLDGSVGQLDIQQQEVTGILRDNGVKLQKLIENLLTFSAWQTQTAALELSEFELKPMVFSVLSQHRLVLSNKKIKLQLTISAINVLADEGKLKLVLENLLSNAIKFTPSGGTIHVGAGMEGTSSSSTSATTAPACIPRTAIESSRRSIKAAGRRAAPSAEPASACRSSPSACKRTAARSSSCAARRPARISECGCRCAEPPTNACGGGQWLAPPPSLLCAALAGCTLGRRRATATRPTRRA